MEFLTIVAVVAIVIIGAIATIMAIAKVSVLYKQRFGFSLWSGVLLFAVAWSLSIISITTSLRSKGQFILLVISALLILLTGYNDIRLAGGSWGVAALCLQILFSFGFIFVVAIALISFVLKKVFKLHTSIFGNGFSVKNEFLLLLLFLHISA